MKNRPVYQNFSLKTAGSDCLFWTFQINIFFYWLLKMKTKKHTTTKLDCRSLHYNWIYIAVYNNNIINTLEYYSFMGCLPLDLQAHSVSPKLFLYLFHFFGVFFCIVSICLQITFNYYRSYVYFMFFNL